MDRLVKFFESIDTSSSRFKQWLTLAVCWLAIVNIAAAQEFPYVAYVTGEQAYVRSGPGQRYYPTGQVQQGYAVEVYRHDADGWCAIRPPQGSYSWVSSHQVRQVEAGVVEVVEDNVVTRVGSTLSPNRSAVQVLLPRGERVELIPTGENDDPRWVRVAAPAGEFRWIAASALSRQPPLEVAPLPKPNANRAGWTQQSLHSPAEATDEPNAFDHLNQHESNANTGLQFGKPQPIAVNEPAPSISSDPNAMEVVTGSPADLQLAQFQLQPAPPTTPNVGRALAATELAVQPRVRFEGLAAPVSATVGSVEELELRLSQAVVKPPRQWELAPLEAAANGLLAEIKTPPVRAQLREVLGRINRFQEVQQRYLNPAPAIVAQRDPFEATTATSLEAVDNTAAGGLTSLSSSVRERVRQDLAASSDSAPIAPAGQGGASKAKPLYDAAGLLKPVVSKRPQAPQYALVDEQGKVVSFVTPTPDLNLKPYVGRRIGVHGTRGFMPEYRRAHVTAGRVTPIEGTIRR